MRVLVVDGSSQDRDLASRYLQSAGHTALVAADAKSGLAAFERDRPEIVVVDSLIQGMPAVQFIERVRQSESEETRAYVVMVSSRAGVGELTQAIGAGADDYMRKPLQRDELVIRVGALERIQGWAAKVFAPPSSPSNSATRIPRLTAWQRVDRSITRDIGELLGQKLEVRSSTGALSPSVIGAQIPLSLASEHTEVRLTVSVDAASVPRLCDLCLGDASAAEDALRDVLRELANTAGGAFMRAAAQEEVCLTSGLPTDLGADSFTDASKASHQKFVVTTEDATLHITFELEILAKALRRVNVGQLTEGMVVARDLHTETGALLVPAGTRLTSSQIERMSRLVSARVTFDVAEAA